ncbi:MAG TPA: 2-hydroxyacyl-CoA dehydratase family protein [Steroidobacteraceae bacterium]|nr:2-hydroxyacyl-CoA dehydratase family protein [Steroidobacteraceae bacterium]
MSQSPSSAAATIEEAYADRLRTAHELKRAGGLVAGFVSTAAPIELIAAAGFHPVMITGDCRGSTELADEWMESLFDPMARAIFQAALSGELEFLDVLIIPRSADSFLRLYLYLREVERLDLCKRLPRVVLYDLLQTQSATSLRHNLDQLRKIGETLKDISGRAVTDDALRIAISDSNRNRQALRSVVNQRSELRLSGAFALKAVTTRFLLPINLHTELLQLLSSKTTTQPKPGGPRIVVAGNAQDNTALHELLDSRGFDIVGNYHWLGDSVSQHDIESSGDPWLAVAEHYHRHSLTSRRFPHLPEELVAHARHRNAQGVLFYLFEPEEALTWDTPNQVTALTAAGMPSLVLNEQPYVVEPTPSLLSELDNFSLRLGSSS